MRGALLAVAAVALAAGCLTPRWGGDHNDRIEAILARDPDPAETAAFDGIPKPHEPRHEARADDDTPPVGTSCIPDDSLAKTRYASSGSKKTSKSSKSSATAQASLKTPKLPKVSVQ